MNYTDRCGSCLENLGATATVSASCNGRRASGAAHKTVFDPDREQDGNTNIVVRRDPATGDATCVLAITGAVRAVRAVDLL